MRIVREGTAMGDQRADEVRQVRLKVLGLLDRLDLPSREPPKEATWDACMRDSVLNAENLRPLKEACHQRVHTVLEDNWAVLERALEDRKPQTLARLNTLRKEVLQHADLTRQYEFWFEPAGNTFGPSKEMEQKIKKLAEELSFLADALDHEEDSIKGEPPAIVRTIVWLWKNGWSCRKYIVVAFFAFIAIPLFWIIMSSLVEGYLSRDEPQSGTVRETRYLSPDPNTHRTGLYPKTKAKIDKKAEYLIREKIDPWLTMGSTKTTITLHDGRTYGYYGVEYGGSVVKLFWERLIDPFLEDAIQEVLDDVGKECRTNNVDAAAPLDEAGSLLRAMVDRVYTRMVSVDQRLRTRANKKEAPRRNVQWEIERMERVVDEQLEAAKALYSNAKT